MMSIVCVYNDRQAYEGCLCASLQAQCAPHELIGIDNTSGTFRSAAAALNAGAQQIRGPGSYIMFAHQDISFESPDWLDRAERLLDGLPGLGIGGVAGKQNGCDTLLTNISDGVPPRKPGQEIREPLAATTLDECCVFIPRAVFEKHRFNEELCRHWHLYAVEFCLRMQEAGLGVYVLPLELHHRSVGTLSRDYFKTFKVVMRGRRDAYPVLYTTCGCWDSRASMLQLWWLPQLKKFFYACTARLIAAGLVPRRLQRKKNRRLAAQHGKEQAP